MVFGQKLLGFMLFVIFAPCEANTSPEMADFKQSHLFIQANYSFGRFIQIGS